MFILRTFTFTAALPSVHSVCHIYFVCHSSSSNADHWSVPVHEESLITSLLGSHRLSVSGLGSVIVVVSIRSGSSIWTTTGYSISHLTSETIDSPFLSLLLWPVYANVCQLFWRHLQQQQTACLIVALFFRVLMSPTFSFISHWHRSIHLLLISVSVPVYDWWFVIESAGRHLSVTRVCVLCGCKLDSLAEQVKQSIIGGGCVSEANGSPACRCAGNCHHTTSTITIGTLANCYYLWLFERDTAWHTFVSSVDSAFVLFCFV